MPTRADTPPTADRAGPPAATLRGPGFLVEVDLARASLRGPDGRPILTPNAAGVGRWVLLDRSPVSARFAGVDTAGRPAAWCRYEVTPGGVSAEVAGGSFAGRDGNRVFIPMGG